MSTTSIHRVGGSALIAGCLLAAAAISAESVTDLADPDRRPHVVAGLAAPVHLALLIGVMAIFAGLVVLAASRVAGRVGLVGAVLLYLAVGLGELPHTVLDMTAIPATYGQLPFDTADALVNDQFYALLGPLGAVALVLFLVGLVLLAVGTLRAHSLPRWSAWASLTGLVAAVALAVIAPSWWFPHAPVALYLGLGAYGIALAATAAGPSLGTAPGAVPVANRA